MKDLIKKVEKILGYRVDRRKKYNIFHGKVYHLESWTQPCSGCIEPIDGHISKDVSRDKNGVALGSGCFECGFHGKVRNSMWVPIIKD